MNDVVKLWKQEGNLIKMMDVDVRQSYLPKNKADFERVRPIHVDLFVRNKYRLLENG